MEWRKAEDMPLSIKKKIEAELDNATVKARGIALFFALFIGIPSLLCTFIYSDAFLIFVIIAVLTLLLIPFLGGNAKKKTKALEENKFLWREDVVANIIWSRRHGRKVFGADNTLYYVQSSFLRFREGQDIIAVKYALNAPAIASTLALVIDPIAYIID